MNILEMSLTKLLVNIFKVTCILVAIFMSGYWIYKFKKNEDITLIEYTLTEDLDSPIFPELTVCFQDPFLTSALFNLTVDEYLKYLMGRTALNQSYNNLKYDEITPNLQNFFRNVTIYMLSLIHI